MTSSGTKAQLAATATYHGEKTASCGGKMEEEDSEIIADKAEGKIKFRDADNSCKDYPYLLKAIPKFSAYGGYTFDKAECKAYKEKFTDKDIFQVSLVIHYKNVAEKTNMHIGFTDYLNNKNKLGVNIQLEKFNNPNNSDDVARSNLKIFDHAMTAFGNVGGHPDYKAIDFEHGIRYAQYSGNHKNRYNLVVDIYGRELMNEVDVDNFMKEYLEAFKFRELR